MLSVEDKEEVARMIREFVLQSFEAHAEYTAYKDKERIGLYTTIKSDELLELRKKAKNWDSGIQEHQNKYWIPPERVKQLEEKAEKWNQHENDMIVCGNPTGYQMREWKEKAAKYDFWVPRWQATAAEYGAKTDEYDWLPKVVEKAKKWDEFKNNTMSSKFRELEEKAKKWDKFQADLPGYLQQLERLKKILGVET